MSATLEINIRNCGTKYSAFDGATTIGFIPWRGYDLEKYREMLLDAFKAFEHFATGTARQGSALPTFPSSEEAWRATGIETRLGVQSRN